MTPLVKVLGGALLMLPLILTAILAMSYSIDHPQLTPMQLENEWGGWFLIWCIPFFAGAILLGVGMEENEEC